MTVDWSDIRCGMWANLELIRSRLDAGADPNERNAYGWSPLHTAAEYGSPEVLSLLVGRVVDLDPFTEGRTPLWYAVYAGRVDNARILAGAGADPWLPMMAGWSPGRLSLAGPTPDLFPLPAGAPGLSPEEADRAALAVQLRTVLADVEGDGASVACVAGIDAASAAQRLSASPARDIDFDDWLEDPPYTDESMVYLGLTDVPGGCVVTQPWGFGASMPGVVNRLSAGTVCYGLYLNSKSGAQGSISRDGAPKGWDLHPGGEVYEDAPADEVLLAYLYRYDAMAYACGYPGLRLTDARAVTGPADVWVELPPGD